MGLSRERLQTDLALLSYGHSILKAAFTPKGVLTPRYF
jgi:hypothetical protein